MIRPWCRMLKFGIDGIADDALLALLLFRLFFCRSHGPPAIRLHLKLTEVKLSSCQFFVWPRRRRFCKFKIFSIKEGLEGYCAPGSTNQLIKMNAEPKVNPWKLAGPFEIYRQNLGIKNPTKSSTTKSNQHMCSLGLRRRERKRRWETPNTFYYTKSTMGDRKKDM